MKKVDFKLPPIGVQVKALFESKKKSAPVPMFNQPLPSGCPHHRMSRILSAISLSLLVAISIPVIILKIMNYTFIDTNHDMGFIFETTEDDGGAGMKVVMAALPRMLFLTPQKITLIAAVLSIFTGIGHLGFVIVDWKDGRRTQAWAFRRNIMFVHVMNSILVLFALVSIFVTHKSSSKFRDGYVNFRASRLNDPNPNNQTETFFRYNIGTFDLETWSCELKSVAGASMVWSDYSKQCAIEVAGRAIMIPFLLFACAVAGVGIWGLVGGGRRGPDGERVKTEDLGLEMDKMNAL